MAIGREEIVKSGGEAAPKLIDPTRKMVISSASVVRDGEMAGEHRTGSSLPFFITTIKRNPVSKLVWAKSHDQGCPPESLSIRHPAIPECSRFCAVVLVSKCRTAPCEPLNVTKLRYTSERSGISRTSPVIL